MNEQIQMSMEELLSLPVSNDLVTAARAFGLGRTKAFELAKAGKFPCRVLQVGKKYRVPRSAIFEALGIGPDIARPQPSRRPSPKRRVHAKADLDPSPAA
jgi:hypothetical protein